MSEQTKGRSMSEVIVHRANSLVYYNLLKYRQEYLDYQVFMVQLMHVHAMDTRPLSCVGRGLGMRLKTLKHLVHTRTRVHTHTHVHTHTISYGMTVHTKEYTHTPYTTYTCTFTCTYTCMTSQLLCARYGNLWWNMHSIMHYYYALGTVWPEILVGIKFGGWILTCHLKCIGGFKIGGLVQGRHSIMYILYSRKFRHFRQCMSLVKIFSVNFFSQWKFWHIDIFPHIYQGM